MEKACLFPLYQYKFKGTILFIIHCHCLLFTAAIYLNLVQFCVAIFKEDIPYLVEMMQTSGAIFPHHLNQIKPSLCQDVIPGPTYLAGSNLRSSSETVRLPLSATSQLNNPKSGFICPSPGFRSPTCNLTTPTSTSPPSAAIQHFSFSPNNLENMPPSGPFYPPISHQSGAHRQFGTHHQSGANHLSGSFPTSCEPGSPQWIAEPERRLAVNARQRSRVQNMNEAFKVLKEKVPGLKDDERTFSKLEVLQCTISYLQHLYSVLGIESSDYQSIPQVQEKGQQLDKRFVVHGGGIKKRGPCKRRPGNLSPTPY